MGDFAGHLLNGLYIAFLAFWWMTNIFTKHIKAQLDNKPYVPELSFFLHYRGWKIPVEQVYKMFFPLLSMVLEMSVVTGFDFVDEKGNMQHIADLIHYVSFSLFAFHAVVDLLTKRGYRFIPEKMDYITGAVAFGCLGLGIYSHTLDENKLLMERKLHSLMTLSIFALSVIFLAAAFAPSFILDFLRSYCMSIFGTWTVHTTVILWKPGLPGNEPNPYWDFDYSTNIHVIPVFFGIHIFLNLAFMIFYYGCCYFIITRYGDRTRTHTREIKFPYTSCPIDNDLDESLEVLLKK